MGKRNRFGIDYRRVQGTHFWKRPLLSRRMLFRHFTAGVGGYFALPGAPGGGLARAQASNVKGTARNVIFILMAGAPSHADTFDLKEGAWTLPAMEPTTYGGLRWPRGLFPRLAEQLDHIALVRSMRAWVPVHGVGQTWTMIGRNPLSGLSKIAPHIGAVVSRELGQLGPDQPVPAFVSLNASSGPNQGYLAAEHAPFYASPNGGGLSYATHPQGQAVFNRRYGMLLEMDAETRAAQDITPSVEEMARFSMTASALMYNPEVVKAFTFDAAERARYGTTTFGNACITARNLLRGNLGPRYIQITLGGWDSHSSIYTTALNPTNANSLARQFDSGLAALIADLAQDGLLSETLIVAFGEFGRTVGPLNTQSGRDHFLTQAALFAGGGVKGGRAIGATDEVGNAVVEPGWRPNREIHTEDVEATIYSALGIDYTKHYDDDPLNRGFYLLPNNQGLEYLPIHELWG